MELYTLEELSRTCEECGPVVVADDEAVLAEFRFNDGACTRAIFMAAATVESARGEKNPARKP